ncbi:MAG: aldehyde dehydrogenase family protein, partial [bacterium]
MAHIYPLVDTKTTEHRPVVSLNPATGEVWQRHPTTPPEKVAEAVEKAGKAQPNWFALGVDGREKILSKLHSNFFEARRELAALVTKEAGKPTVEAMIAEIMTSLDFAKFYLKHGKSILRIKKWRHQNIALKT